MIFRGQLAGLALLGAVALSAVMLPGQEARFNQLTQQITALGKEKKYAEAVPVATEALKVARATYSAGDVHIVFAMTILARLCDQVRDYEHAEAFFKAALGTAEKADGPDDPDVAMALTGLADLYDELARYAEAEPLYARALKIDEKALPPDDPGLVGDVNNLAMVYESEDRFADAEPLLSRALKINEKAKGPDDILVAKALNNLAEVYEDEGRYKDAEPLLIRSLSIREKALGPEDPEVATGLTNLAGLYRDEGDYARAEPLNVRALHIDEKALGADDPDVATDLNDLATVYQDQARYAEAEPLYERSLGIRKKADGPDHPDVATALSNLAGLYQMQGKYAEAAPLLKQAFEIDQKAFGSDSLNVAKDTNNIATLLEYIGENAEAEEFAQRSLDILEKKLGPDHVHVADALSNMGSLESSLGHNEKSEALLSRAIKIDEKALGPDNPGLAFPLNNLAFDFESDGKFGEAEPLYKRTLQIQEKALGADHPDLVNTLSNLAGMYVKQGNSAQAQPAFQRAFDLLFHQFQYNFTYMTEKDRLSFMDTVSELFPQYFRFVSQYHEKEPQLVGSMYDVLLWQKGFIASSVASMRRQIEASGDQEALKLLAQLTAKRTQLATLLNSNPPNRDEWRRQVDQLRTESDALEKQVVEKSASFAQQKRLERATWQQVRDALKPGEAAVEFARFDADDPKQPHVSEYVALVVTAETKDEPQFILLGDSKQIEGDAVTSFERTTQTRGFVEPAKSAAVVPGAKAYELIAKPLEQALTGKTRVYLSADGILNQIPIGLIPMPDGKLLMERYDLRLVSSTKDILREAGAQGPKAALLVGDPLFSLTEDEQTAAVHKLSSTKSHANQGQAHLTTAALEKNNQSRDLTGTTLKQLPWTGAEVTAIAGLMQSNGWKATSYTQEVALKQIVEQAGSQRVIHLATHGFFLPDEEKQPAKIAHGGPHTAGLEDPMLRSGLYFSGANRTLAGKPAPDGLDNGVLTALEAGNLNLTGTELVVLSACNTGQGEVQNGEGVFGLRRALQEAGAQAVMMSLWSVPDKETLELMQIFYSKWLSGTEKHEALKQAQLEMREKVKQAHDGHDLPYYWGAFVMVGN